MEQRCSTTDHSRIKRPVVRVQKPSARTSRPPQHRAAARMHRARGRAHNKIVARPTKWVTGCRGRATARRKSEVLGASATVKRPGNAVAKIPTPATAAAIRLHTTVDFPLAAVTACEQNSPPPRQGIKLLLRDTVARQVLFDMPTGAFLSSASPSALRNGLVLASSPDFYCQATFGVTAATPWAARRAPISTRASVAFPSSRTLKLSFFSQPTHPCSRIYSFSVALGSQSPVLLVRHGPHFT